jgi:hypothetical protein
MYVNRNYSEHLYSIDEISQLIGKTTPQILRLIKKGYLQAVRTESGKYVVTDQQLSNYYLYGQFGRRPTKSRTFKS